MEIKTITYKRTKNLGNYESEYLELSAEIAENDNIDTAIEVLKIKVHKHLGLIEDTEDSNKEVPFF